MIVCAHRMTREEWDEAFRLAATRVEYSAGLLQSPLTDSNRRPPPYHAIQRQPVAAGGNGLSLFQAIFGLLATRTFATRCAPSIA